MEEHACILFVLRFQLKDSQSQLQNGLCVLATALRANVALQLELRTRSHPFNTKTDSGTAFSIPGLPLQKQHGSAYTQYQQIGSRCNQEDSTMQCTTARAHCKGSRSGRFAACVFPFVSTGFLPFVDFEGLQRDRLP